MSPLRPFAALVSALVLALLPAAASTAASPAVGAMVDPSGEWPLRPAPEVVRAFDPPAAVWGSGHRGVDLAGRVGQEVRAALPGRVSFVGSIAGVGVVSVDHGTTRTTYQPVSPTVTRGEQVGAGTVIGSLDWYGTHCLPRSCLHWGLLEGDRYLDPLTLVGGPRPVRLLPLDAAAGTGPETHTLGPQPAHVLLRVLTPWG